MMMKISLLGDSYHIIKYLNTVKFDLLKSLCYGKFFKDQCAPQLAG